MGTAAAIPATPIAVLLASTPRYGRLLAGVRARGRTGPPIAALTAVHSAYFLVEALFVLHLAYAGLRGRATRLTRVALVGVVVEGAIWLLNRRRCPLTGVVEDLGAAHGPVSDIFLPGWFARRIPQLSGALLTVGAGAALLRLIRARRCFPSIYPDTHVSARGQRP